MNALKEDIKVFDADLKKVEDEYTELMLSLPNLPDPDLKFGGKENNVPLRYMMPTRMFDNAKYQDAENHGGKPEKLYFQFGAPRLAGDIELEFYMVRRYKHSIHIGKRGTNNG